MNHDIILIYVTGSVNTKLEVGTNVLLVLHFGFFAFFLFVKTNQDVITGELWKICDTEPCCFPTFPTVTRGSITNTELLAS